MSCSLSLEDIKKTVDCALQSLKDNDYDLLDCNVNERTISCRLAVYLQQGFQDWNVDCEYNRNMDDPKKLKNLPWRRNDVTDYDSDAKTVYPDIIVHHRQSRENLLVIEMKKAGRNADRVVSKDVAKLEAFTKGEEYGYRFGLLLIVSRESSPNQEWCQQQWYQDGKESE